MNLLVTQMTASPEETWLLSHCCDPPIITPIPGCVGRVVFPGLFVTQRPTPPHRYFTKESDIQISMTRDGSTQYLTLVFDPSTPLLFLPNQIFALWTMLERSPGDIWVWVDEDAPLLHIAALLVILIQRTNFALEAECVASALTRRVDHCNGGRRISIPFTLPFLDYIDKMATDFVVWL